MLQKLLDFLGTTLEPYYGFQSLFAFKQKFQPEHHPMYLVFPDTTALAEIGIAVARAYMPDAGLWDWIDDDVGHGRAASGQAEPAPATVTGRGHHEAANASHMGRNREADERRIDGQGHRTRAASAW